MKRNLVIIFGIFFYILVFFLSGSLVAQDDSLLVKAPPGQIDTLRLLSDQPLKSPWGAVLRSAILPGWGQLYNQKYIKSVVVFAINGVLVWQILDYNKQWQDTGSQSFRDRRNQYMWLFGLTYLLTMVDAYVDAYLFGFNKAMDISWMPPERERSAWMLSLRLTL